MSNLILAICSKGKCKEREENDYDRNLRTVACVIPDDMRWKLNETRDLVFQHIKNPARKGRFSDKLPLNKELKPGPDIGHDCEKYDGYYIPTLKQYKGKFHKAFKNAVGNADHCIQRMNNDSQDHLLIVSGLYGLLTPSEPIQTNDCYVRNEPTIEQLWKKDNLLTELALSCMRECDINRVFDFMVEDSYRHLINWRLIKEYDNTIFYPHCENQTGIHKPSELGKAAGLLLSGKTTQKLSEIKHLDKINSTHMHLSLKPPPKEFVQPEDVDYS